MDKIDIIKRLIEERLNQKSFSDIQSIIKEEFGKNIDKEKLRKMYDIEVTNMSVPEDAVTIVDRDTIIENLVKNKAEKMEFILKNIENILDYLSSYKSKTMKWLDSLEKDLENYYIDAKEKRENLSLKQIQGIQDTIAKTRSLIAADIEEYTKVLKVYHDFIELTKPTDVKINKLDVAIMIKNEINNVQKAGYIIAMPRSEEAKELLKKMEEAGELMSFN